MKQVFSRLHALEPLTAVGPGVAGCWAGAIRQCMKQVFSRLLALEPLTENVPLGQGRQLLWPALALYVLEGHGLHHPVPGAHSAQ